MHCAGIETGYGFFAPNVADNNKLVFQLSYSDGRTEVVLPTVGSTFTGVRLINLLDRLREIEYPPLREMVVRMMAEAAWRDHPEATSIRAIFGAVHAPTLEAFKRGERASYETLSAYDFVRAPFAPP